MKRLDIHIEMENGDTFDVKTKTADYLLFETTAKRHKWGGVSENPALWEAFLAFAASRRVGKFTGTWEVFQKEVDIVEATPEDVDPTNEVVGDAYLSS
jgi:hypothetical protein